MTDSTDTAANPHQLELFEKSVTTADTLSVKDFSALLRDTFGGGSLVHKAIRTAAFLACADVLAQDISKATFRLRSWAQNGTSTIVMPTKNEIAGMLALEPNPRHTWSNFFEMMVYWLVFKDNAYAVIFRDLMGNPIKVVPVQSPAVMEQVVYNETTNEGEIWYHVTASTQQEQQLLGAAFRKVPERDMIHVRKRLIDGFCGYGTINAGQKTLDIMQSIDEFRDNLFSEEGQLRGVFSMGKDAPELSDVAFDRLREQFKELMSRWRELTAPIILEGGMTFNAISSKPSDMELTKQFEAQVGQMCRLFRVPPHKIFLMDGSKYSNMESQDKAYVSDVLVPIAKAIEGEFGKKLMPDRNFRLRNFFQFDRDEMSVRDTVQERESVIKAVERGLYELDEGRGLLGRNPLPNGAGQVRLIPTNMAVVDRNNNVLIGGASTPASDSKQPGEADTPPADEKPQDNTKSAPVLRLVGSAGDS